MSEIQTEIQKRVHNAREEMIQFMLEICEIPSMDSQIGPVGERVQAEMRKLGFDEVRFGRTEDGFYVQVRQLTIYAVEKAPVIG